MIKKGQEVPIAEYDFNAININDFEKENRASRARKQFSKEN
jgi:hypothetical protein